MARKNKGVAFLLVGFILLSIAGGWYAYNIIEDKNAGEKAAELLAQFDKIQQEQTALDDDTTNNESSNDTPGEKPPVIVVDGDAFCGKVIVECVGIELPVYDGWDYKRLKAAPCRYTGGIETNDMIIAAHNYKRHFGALKNVRIGDEVKFVDAYGTTHLYEVCELITLDGTAVSDMHAGDWDFTLFTCTKGGVQRVTVRCERKE